jgi:hypothetical protein
MLAGAGRYVPEQNATECDKATDDNSRPRLALGAGGLFEENTHYR